MAVLVAVVQARFGSTRLPGKALADLAGRPVLAHVVERASAIPGVDEVVVATTTVARDDALADWARGRGIACVRGSEDDVLDRFVTALAAHPADAVVRVTADCPLLDPQVAGQVVAAFLRGPEPGRTVAGSPPLQYASNVDPPTFPDGLDTEVVAREALLAAWREARLPSDREHVTPWIRRHPERFPQVNVRAPEDLSGLRWTVDTEADLAFVRAVHERLASGRHLFGMREVLALLRAHPELSALNAGQRRNEGYARSLAADPAPSRQAPPVAARPGAPDGGLP
jgi:spore coat polysaccharide biosynthesis protein SpsF (cytidylyltransferase family)